MSKLWKAVVEIADKTGSIAAGDTACGFANTAMVLLTEVMYPRCSRGSQGYVCRQKSCRF